LARAPGPGPAAVILAAGTASRFGGVKVLAPLHGRPLLQHVIDAVHEAGVAASVIVLGTAADRVRTEIQLRGDTQLVINPRPEDGLSGSVRLGLGALDDRFDRAVLLLGDQPVVRTDVIRALLAEAVRSERPIVVPRYDLGGGPNPVVIRRSAWPLAEGLAGDRGFGPVLRRHAEMVHVVPVKGENPDVDTQADLAALEQAP
jgi:molybdenum cofactor cytidylyltransferase